MSKIGLIAGNRTFPIHIARAAKAQGYEVIAVGLREETDPALEQEVRQMHWFSLKEVGNVPDFLKENQIKDVILAGQIKPERVLQSEENFDPVTKTLLSLIPDRKGSSLMKMAVHYLESKGFHVLNSATFLKDWIPQSGVLTRRQPTQEERSDITYGMPLAIQLNRWGIGQTLVVRRGSAVAIEAVEGTDATIRRAGEIVGPGCVVIKACGPDHDMCFDIPVVGMETLRVMKASGAVCLGIEARRTLLFDRPSVLAYADEADLSIVAL